MVGQVNAPGTTVLFGYDPTTHLYLPAQVSPLATDNVNGEDYAKLIVESIAIDQNGNFIATLGQSNNPSYVVPTAGPTGPTASFGQQGEQNVSSGGAQTQHITASGTIITRAGRLSRILSNATPSAVIILYDSNNSTITGKTPVGYVLTTDVQGTIKDLQFPVANGIYCSFGGTGDITVGYD